MPAARSIKRRSCISCLQSRNLDGSVGRRHELSFRVADNQPDKVSARLHIKTGPDRNARAQPLCQSLVAQTHLENLLIPGDQVSIAVEKAGSDGEIVAVATVRFSKAYMFHIHLNQYS